MAPAKKKNEHLCNKCVKISECIYKISDNKLVLLRCLDFIQKENSEDEK